MCIRDSAHVAPIYDYWREPGRAYLVSRYLRGGTLAQLLERDVEVSSVQHNVGGAWVEGRGEDWNSFIFFSDPDGNRWAVQQVPDYGRG